MGIAVYREKGKNKKYFSRSGMMVLMLFDGYSPPHHKPSPNAPGSAIRHLTSYP
jgi:hypothetical protein